MIKENIKILLKFLLLFLFLGIVEIRAITLSIQKPYIRNVLIKEKAMPKDDIIISFVGDCTLGTGVNYSYGRR